MTFNLQTALEGSIDVENRKENFDKESSICEIVKKLRSKQIENMRRDGRNQDFKLLCEIGFEPMISRETWKMNRGEVNVGNLLTVADETFALLTMENNINEWMHIEVHGKDSITRGELTRYISQGSNSDGTKKGWTLEGKKRFNELYDAVVLKRGTQVSEMKEVWAKNEWKKEMSNKRRRQTIGENEGDDDAAQAQIEEETFVPKNGFTD